MTDYLNGFHYENKNFRFFATAEGYVDIRARMSEVLRVNYVYNYTDHLGNIRLSYTKGTGTNPPVILEENHYYPFGLKHKKYGSVDKDLVCVDEDCYEVGIDVVPPQARKTYQMKYNGKEFQDELGLNFYDFGFRNYAPDLGRWMNIDPLGEKYYTTSPYAYTLNNPMFFVDPDGREIWIYFGKDNKEREQYSYQKDRDYSGMSGFRADAYKALDALYVAGNINVDGKQVNVVQSLMDSKKELSLVEDPKGGDSKFKPSRNFRNFSDDNTRASAYNDIGTVFFDSTQGIMFDDIVNPSNPDYFINQLNTSKFNKTTQINSPASILGHELIHAYNKMDDSRAFHSRKGFNPVMSGKYRFINEEEKRATSLSTQININLGENPRYSHQGLYVPTQGVMSNQLKN